MNLLSAVSAKGDVLSETIQTVPTRQKVKRAKCSCDSGWSGADCSVQLCPKDCNKRGVCNSGVCFCDKGFYGDDCGVREAITQKLSITPEMAALELCNNICVHGKCLSTPPQANFSVFRHRLNRQSTLVPVAQNASQYYACFCEPSWAGVRCSRSLVTCPAECLDAQGVCRKDCKYANKNLCPVNPTTGKMCSGRSRGKCNTGTGVCKCAKNWHGLDCGTASCPDNCNGRGMCNSRTQKCLCFAPWTGDSCNIRMAD